MKKFVMTSKGRVTIPANLRRKYGLKKGTVVSFYERDGQIAVLPLTDRYIMKALREQKAEERKREDARDLAAFRMRAREPNVPFEQIQRGLQR